MDNIPKPARILFTCSKCGKQINLNHDIFETYYKGHDLCIICRPADPARILTEEELQSYEAYVPPAVINSLRALLSANAELSFENMRLKAECKTVNDDYKALVDIFDRARKLTHLLEGNS